LWSWLACLAASERSERSCRCGLDSAGQLPPCKDACIIEDGTFESLITDDISATPAGKLEICHWRSFKRSLVSRHAMRLQSKTCPDNDAELLALFRKRASI